MTKRCSFDKAGMPLSRIVGVVGVGLLAANCAANTGRKHYASREVGAFPESKYGKASPRVVADGQPVPKGGGRYLVGHPYSVAGREYRPHLNPHYSRVGLASWYGEAFHGRRTANGEVYDAASISAAHPTMPLPSYARVTNLQNHRSMVVRVNDRGPFHGGRIMDVSERVAYYLNFKSYGTAKVRVDYIGPASLAGSDDRKLLATLRTGDDAPAPFGRNPVMVASADLGAPAARSESVIAPAPVVPARESVIASAALPEQPASAPLAPRDPQEAFRMAAGIPLPPDRPFESGPGLPAAAPAVQVAALQPPHMATPPAPPPVMREAAFRTPAAPRPAVQPALGYAAAAPRQPVAVSASFGGSDAELAALYFAEPESLPAAFTAHGNPMARIKSANMVPMNAVPSPVAGALVVQAGLFRDHANALRLAAAIGKSAHVRAEKGKDGALYAVTAGPFATTAQAEAARASAVRAGAADARLSGRQG